MYAIRLNTIGLSIILILSFFSSSVFAQMERERAETNEPEEMFWTPQLFASETVQQVPARHLNVTIMHTFGILTENTIDNFFGLDLTPNVRLGLDYGINEAWSIGIGRSSREDVVDLRTKLSLLKQNQSGDPPLSLSLKADMGITTESNGYAFDERLSYLAGVMAAKKFSDAFTLQISPLYAHFNRVFGDEESDLFGVAVGGEYRLSRRFALMFEYLPVLSDRTEGTHNAFTAGVHIETGGHVFQLFFSSPEWHTEQYALARNTDEFWAGDFRFGFNVNRIFSFGGD